MLKKPLNKIRQNFLEASFSENPLPFKKLNKKGRILNINSNKRGISDRIEKIQEKIHQRYSIEKQNRLKEEVDSVAKTHNLTKDSCFQERGLDLTKDKNNIIDTSLLPSFAISKSIFSLEQLKAEFSKKKSAQKKGSLFKKLLEERKKLSLIYGSLSKKQIQKLFFQAKKFDGKFDENFIKIIESRLDVVLFRICFFPTIFSARQWINHKHILVNNSIVSLASYQLKSGDIISVSTEKKKLLKTKISTFVTSKIKIRSRHYRLRIDTFYILIKNLTFALATFSGFFNLISKTFTTINQVNNKKVSLFFKKNFSKIFKGIEGVKRKKIEKSLSLFPKILSDSVSKNSKLLPFLKIRNLFTLVRPLRRKVGTYSISGMKALNLEVCYKNMVAIFLYSPQKVALPAALDLHYIAKSFR